MFERVALLLWLLAPTPEALLRAADASRYTLEEGVMRIHASVVDKSQETSLSILDVYVKGKDRALCVFREGKQKDRKVLMVGDRVWLLVPGVARPIAVSANQRLLGGASIADVARLHFADEFRGTLRPDEERVNDVLCRIVDLEGESPEASYASGTLWVGKDDGLPRKARLSLRSGKPAKEILFVTYVESQGKTVLQRMEIRHLLPSERGMVTVLDFNGYEAQVLEPDLFDPALARGLP